jgi:hypothetical protein
LNLIPSAYETLVKSRFSPHGTAPSYCPKLDWFWRPVCVLALAA